MHMCAELGLLCIFVRVVWEIGFVLQGQMLHTCCLSPQVHFVPDAGTVAQIVYAADDQVRPPQQVVYTADGASYTSVDGPEHTLVYIHPVEAAQACEWVLCLVRLVISEFTNYLGFLSASHHRGCWYRKYLDKICAFKELITSLAEKDMIYLFKLNVLEQQFSTFFQLMAHVN